MNGRQKSPKPPLHNQAEIIQDDLINRSVKRRAKLQINMYDQNELQQILHKRVTCQQNGWK